MFLCKRDHDHYACLGHSDHDMTDSWGSKEGESVEMPPWTSGGQVLACFRSLVDRLPEEAALKGRGIQEG